jgi:hypothetical protein
MTPQRIKAMTDWLMVMIGSALIGWHLQSWLIFLGVSLTGNGLRRRNEDYKP